MKGTELFSEIRCRLIETGFKVRLNLASALFIRQKLEFASFLAGEGDGFANALCGRDGEGAPLRDPAFGFLLGLRLR